MEREDCEGTALYEGVLVSASLFLIVVLYFISVQDTRESVCPLCSLLYVFQPSVTSLTPAQILTLVGSSLAEGPNQDSRSQAGFNSTVVSHFHTNTNLYVIITVFWIFI